MAKSCREIAQSLVDCMKSTPCVKAGGDVMTCLKAKDNIYCQELRSAYFSCKRGSLDMRNRIRGDRVY